MYTPTPVPSDAKDIPKYLANEVNVIARALSGSQPYWILAKLYAEPKSVKEDMLVQADGTTWNPGSGAGIYQYRSGVWVFIG
jgi:hypothetical protein